MRCVFPSGHSGEGIGGGIEVGGFGVVNESDTTPVPTSSMRCSMAWKEKLLGEWQVEGFEDKGVPPWCCRHCARPVVPYGRSVKPFVGR